MIATAFAVTGWFFAIWFALKYRHWRMRYGNLYRSTILLRPYCPAASAVPNGAAPPEGGGA